MTRIVIVGAGLLGASLADRLAERGANVTVVEASRPGAGTSGSSFAWINAQDKAPADYFALNVAGVAAHRALAHGLGGDWYHPGGDIVIGRGSAAAVVRERVERHLALDYDVHELHRTAVAALEPDLDLRGEEAFAAAHFPSEAWIDPPLLIGRLLRRARSSGARVLHDAEVVDLDVRDGRLGEIVTRGGDRLSADQFVFAAGPATQRLAELAGVSLPMAPTPGLLAVTEPVALTIAHVIHAEEITVRPAGGGRLMLASRQVDATLDPALREIATEADAPPRAPGQGAPSAARPRGGSARDRADRSAFGRGRRPPGGRRCARRRESLPPGVAQWCDAGADPWGARCSRAAR